jgi:nucleoside-diphosphate-sugar epimerase
MHIYYYGGSGFIGKHNLKMFNSNSIQVLNISRDLLNLNPLKMEPKNDFKKILILANGCSLQNRQSFGIERDLLRIEIEQHKLNYKSLIDRLNSNLISNIIFLSSGGAIYDRSDMNKKNELAKVQPTSSYGLLKYELEKYLQLISYDYSIPLTILRMGNVYGPGQIANRGQGLIATTIDRLMNKKEILVVSNSVRDYLHVSDFNSMLLGVLKDLNRFNGIFNLGTGIGISSKEVSLKISEIMNLHGYQYDFDKLIIFSDLKRETDSSILDCSKYYSISKNFPSMTLANGIDGMIKDLK